MKSTILLPSIALGSVAVAFAFGSKGFTNAAPAAVPVLEPSAKATCAVSEVHLMNTSAATGWTNILSSSIKTANNSDIFCDVAVESGLVTQTEVASKGKKDTSTASAEIRVRCLVDGQVAHPGEVVFASRTQELSATFQGLIAECFTANEDGTVTLDETCVEPEQLELVQSTMSANAFNFVCPNVGSGMHSMQIQAMVTTSSYSEGGTASAYGLLGKGSCTIEQVRMVNDSVEFN